MNNSQVVDNFFKKLFKGVDGDFKTLYNGYIKTKQEKNMLGKLLDIFIYIVLLGLFILQICVFWNALSNAVIVHKSWSTKECVFIQTKDKNYDCSELNKFEKYDILWVK